MTMTEPLSELEKSIGYEFKDKALLRRSVSHSSYSNEASGDPTLSNERLEFLGDAILEVSVSLMLFKAFPHKQEGELTRMRASLVCERSLGSCGKAFGLQRFLLLGRGEELSGGRERISIIADAVEALIGAVYLDGGFVPADGLIKLILSPSLEKASRGEFIKDAKTELQELLQRHGSTHIEYRILSETGPDHDKFFEAEVSENGSPIGSGSGRSKKEAETAAAEDALVRIKR